jgi:hypothetical protein
MSKSPSATTIAFWAYSCPVPLIDVERRNLTAVILARASRDLKGEAAEERISLNRLVNLKLSAAG